jgi:hypothetical protein
MRIACLSTAPSVGKTMIVSNVLYPRLPGYLVIAIDTTNESAKDFGIPAVEYDGNDFQKAYKDVVRNPNVLLDVGGSKEGREFLEGMNWLEGQDEIDYFVIPCMPENKDQKEAIRTIKALLAQGVENEKIKIVFNKVRKNTATEFDWLMGFLAENKIEFSLSAVIFDNPAFNAMAGANRTVASMKKDKTDYKALIRAETDEDKVEQLSDLLMAQKSANKIEEMLDGVFNALFPPKKEKSAQRAETAKA